MKRDEDLLRKLLMEFEAADLPFQSYALSFDDGAEELAEIHHLRLLADAGLLAEIPVKHGECYRLTNQGHDFIEAIRDDTRWNRAKEIAGTAGARTLGILREVAVALGKQKVRELTGIELP